MAADDGRNKPGRRPTREELVAVLGQHERSVRATAKHYARERRQIYRWLELYGLRSRKGC